MYNIQFFINHQEMHDFHKLQYLNFIIILNLYFIPFNQTAINFLKLENKILKMVT